MKISIIKTTVGVITALALLNACKKDDPAPQSGYQPYGQQGYPQGQQGYPQGQQGYPQGQQGYPQGQGQQGYPQGQQGGQQQPPPNNPPPQQQQGGQVQNNPQAAAMGAPLLEPLRNQHAMPGNQPQGEPIGANLQEGQWVETQVTLEPGKCYTGIGMGTPPIGELEVSLNASGPVPLTGSQGRGLPAVLGSKPNCVRNPAPFGMPAVFRLKAIRGSGVASARLYAR